MTAGRVFFYVQHLLGIGHTMRAAALTRAMQHAGLDVTYVSGGFDSVALDLAGASRRQLPPVRAADATFKTLVGDGGHPIDDAWRIRRRTALLDAFDAADPDIVLIEMFPFGRWPFRFELLPLLDTARRRRRRPKIVCSVRDILVPKTDPTRLSAIVETIREYFDAVLVHGDPDFVRFDETFPRAPEIAERIHYTGYIAPPGEARTTASDQPGEVLVSAGGGSTGGKLMRTALAARAQSCLTERPWRFLVGPNLPAEDRAKLVAQHPGVTIEPLRPDYRTLLADCAVSISQAGYNTVMDILTCGARSILVPFSAGQQTEQATRAGRMAARGWTQVLPEEMLAPDTLAAAIAEAMAVPRPTIAGLNLGGADRSATILAGMARRSTDREASHVAQMPL